MVVVVNPLGQDVSESPFKGAEKGFCFPFMHFVKLYSDLRILTQLQLVGVGVDFVFPLEEKGEPTPSF